MRNVKLTLQYDGTAYAGFQRQPNGLTIQELLEGALSQVHGQPTKIAAAAGRTDAGVHALGQVVNFFTEARVPTERWPLALNRHLPADVVVVEAVEVAADWHARFAAVGKRYRYRLDNGPVPCPVLARYCHHWGRPLALDAMQAAAQRLTGRHDFAAFRSSGGAARTTVRTIHRLEVVTQPRPDGRGEVIDLVVEGDGFLYNMVRIIAGTLLEVGAGRRSLAQVEAALATGERTQAGQTLPAKGLCLEAVYYA